MSMEASICQLIKKFLLFYNFALTQRCFFKTISFSTFNFQRYGLSVYKFAYGISSACPTLHDQFCAILIPANSTLLKNFPSINGTSSGSRLAGTGSVDRRNNKFR
jgi:hypothetical protein